MNILITGFEPFGGEKINPSEMVAKRLKAPAGHSLEWRVLPVSFETIGEAVDAAVSEVRPDVVLSLGQAGGRSCITPEMIAVNLASTRSNDGERLLSDDHGFAADDLPIIEGAPDAYLSTIDARKAVTAAREVGVDAEASFSAGTYLCNCVMYRFIHIGRLRGFRAGFVHLPYLPEQAANNPKRPPSMPFDEQLKGVQAIVDGLIR